MKFLLQSIKVAIRFCLQFILLTVSTVAATSGSLCYSLYLLYHRKSDQEQQSHNNNNRLDCVILKGNFEEARKYWCFLKSCEFDQDDNYNVEDVTREQSSSVRHVSMRNCCLSATTILEAANEAAKEQEVKNIELEKNKQTMDVILIPIEFVTGLIGFKGSHIKEIETLSNTRISIKVENNNSGDKTRQTTENRERLCVIRGKTENVLLAQGLIREYIDSHPVVTVKEIYVPKMCVGRIIGRRGETRKCIQDTTKVKFNVEPGNKKNVQNKVEEENNKDEFNSLNGQEETLACVVIKGTIDQINSAEIMMLKIVQEEQYRRKEEKKVTSKYRYQFNPNSQASSGTQ